MKAGHDVVKKKNTQEGKKHEQKHQLVQAINPR